MPDGPADPDLRPDEDEERRPDLVRSASEEKLEESDPVGSEPCPTRIYRIWIIFMVEYIKR